MNLFMHLQQLQCKSKFTAGTLIIGTIHLYGCCSPKLCFFAAFLGVLAWYKPSYGYNKRYKGAIFTEFKRILMK